MQLFDLEGADTTTTEPIPTRAATVEQAICLPSRATQPPPAPA
jgi:hypothetical protein